MGATGPVQDSPPGRLEPGPRAFQARRTEIERTEASMNEEENPTIQAQRPSSLAPGDAGAVPRRRPPADDAASDRAGWPIRSLRRPPPIVDNRDAEPIPPPAERRPARIVDSRDAAVPAPQRRGLLSRIVDINSAGQGTQPAGHGSMPGATDPVPVRLKAPGEAKVSGPSGPDVERLRRLREARKQKAAARARARGVDPGAGSVETAPGVTRSEKTYNQYLDRGRMLVRRYRRELDLGSHEMDAVNPIEFVNWLFSLKPSFKPSTWRPYRQAAKAILATMPHDDTEAAIAMIDADINEAAAMNAEEAPKPANPKSRKQGLPRRTSGLKEKRFPKDDFDKVIAYLRYYSRSRFAPILIDWMIAGVSTGLRPIEWQATEIEIREDPVAPQGRWIWLYVLNAKATNGRSNGIVRTLDLSHFGDATLKAVRRMSERGSQWLEDGIYDTMQSQCSQLLYTVCDKLFTGRKRTYALYSLRHQFVANAKSYHRPEAVSALVGHVVTDTATANYAKRYSAWGPEEITDRPEPVPEEISTVRQRLRFFEERQRIREAAGLAKPARSREEN